MSRQNLDKRRIVGGERLRSVKLVVSSSQHNGRQDVLYVYGKTRWLFELEGEIE